MPLKIYNTKSRRKEVFTPLVPPHVTLYVCGVTVYDYCHLGHARAAVVFDILYRYLQHQGYQVTYVRNFTDIDDKIIRRSQERGEDWRQLTARFIKAFHEDMDALGNLRPSHEPRATDYIAEMQSMIARLVDQGMAYSSGGDVYYSIRAFPSYGELSGKRLEDLEVGARVEIDEDKRDPLDFALWKQAKPGEPQWDSPWGAGRPGWHIECSAMSTQCLGPTLDIHGGGRDLIFPHHENERAQSEGATGQTFARYWVHNGFVNLMSEKMSKSTGNFMTIRDFLKEYSGEVLRYFLLGSHYRSPLDFTDQNLKDALSGLERVYSTLERLNQVRPVVQSACADLASPVLFKDFAQRFAIAMDDDCNTAQALAAFFEVIREVNRFLDQGLVEARLDALRAEVLSCLNLMRQVLGIFCEEPENFFKKRKGRALSSLKITEDEILQKIEARAQARLQRDFKRADAIRQELLSLGIELKDNPDGTTLWILK